MEDSRIQILLAVFNGAQYLEAQIESLRAQTYPDWELLISDDGSSDGSLEIIDFYCNLDSRIHLVLDGVVAGSAKLNFFNLLGLAKADYVMFCDQDDVWDEDKIEVTLNRMREVESHNSEMPILVATDLRVVDQNLNLISESFLKMSGMKSSKTDFGYFMSSCLVTGCTMMANRSLCALVQRVDLNPDPVLMHDWWLSLVASAFGRVSYINSQTISYRQHGSNSVGAKKRSILNALMTIEDMHQHMLETIDQVDEFKRVYGADLGEGIRKQMESYLSIRNIRPWCVPACLSAAGAWRDDTLGNIGMVLALIWR